MKTLIIAAAMVAFMGSPVAFAEKVTAPAQPVAQNEATVSAFEGVETVAVSSEEMEKTAGIVGRPKMPG